jgi:hypothetical protein
MKWRGYDAALGRQVLQLMTLSRTGKHELHTMF